MPKVNDQFAGHMYPDDPRNLLFSTEGCTWPTMPAWRYRALSENATGLFSELNGDGILVPFVSYNPNNSITRWEFTGGTGNISDIRFFKVQAPTDGIGFGMICEMDLLLLKVEARRRLGFSPQKCNFNVLFGNFPAIDPAFGNAGSTFTMKQVVWDEELPPD